MNVFANLDTYLGTFAGAMADRVDRALSPLFDPERDELSDAVTSLTECEMVPYPAQAVAVEGMLRCLQTRDVCWLVGEMGTGKTPMAIWLIQSALYSIRARERETGRRMRVVITAPNQLVKKWQSHAQRIIPDCRATIVRNYRDLVHITKCSDETEKQVPGSGRPVTQRVKRWRSPQQTEIWIIPRDRGKLGYAWSTGVLSRERRITYTEGSEIKTGMVETFHCPKCAALIADDDGQVADHDYFTTSRGKLSSRRKCGSCGEQLWQAYNGRRSPAATHGLPSPGIAPRRMSPAAYLRKIGVRFDIYFADEVHELKGEGTLQGQMFADLCMISRKIVPLTGTLVGGYAENLLHLLWRTIPWRMQQDALSYNSEGFRKFIELYGVLQTVKRFQGDKRTSTMDLIQGRGKQMSRREKTLPGISPLLFTNFMLDSAVFLRLMEMHAHLPEFNERVHTIQPTKEQDLALAKMQDQFEQHRRSHRACRCWSSARAAFLRWVDKPWIDPFTIYDRNDDDMPFPAFHVPSLPFKEYPKERRVRRLVVKNMLRGRKTWIYTELAGQGGTPAWDWMDYLAEYLRRYGVRVAVLRSGGQGGPKPEDREEWIDRISPEVDVVISNPSLVKTGLDLYHFPSIIYAYCGDNTYTLRQASRRSWRLGQQYACEVDYLVYTGVRSRSVQEAALSLMAQKMEAALAIEGDFSSEGLAAMSGGRDMATALARFIDGQLDEIDPVHDAFARYRKKLEACMPQLGTDVRDRIQAPPLRPIQPIPQRTSPMPPLLSAPKSDAAKLLQSMGIDVSEAIARPAPKPAAPSPRPPAPKPPAPKAPTQADRVFERNDRVATEPSSLHARKQWRREALALALGVEADEVRGDRARFGDQWVQIVAKARQTVRARNFEAVLDEHPSALIAFVEPPAEAGPTSSSCRVTVRGLEYVVSLMSASEYVAGERTPGDVKEYQTCFSDG